MSIHLVEADSTKWMLMAGAHQLLAHSLAPRPTRHRRQQHIVKRFCSTTLLWSNYTHLRLCRRQGCPTTV